MHLRFLIAVPRRLPPVTFTHRSYRGQRTAEDPFWPEYFTFVCTPCIGEEHKTSLDVMRELFEHCTQSQPEAARLILPLVELHDPATGKRVKLTGRETITPPLTESADMETKLRQLQQADLQPPSVNKSTPEGSGDTPVPSDTSPSAPEGRWDTPVPSEPVPSDSPPSDFPSANAPQEPATSLLSNVRAILLTEGKQQAKTLATRLDVPLDDIRALLTAPESTLINKGGWIQPKE